jgi:hypothetical protein
MEMKAFRVRLARALVDCYTERDGYGDSFGKGWSP